MPLLNQREVNDALRRLLESDDGPLWQIWENGNFPEIADDEDSWENSLSQLRAASLKDLTNESGGDVANLHPLVLLYKSVVELTEAQTQQEPQNG